MGDEALCVGSNRTRIPNRNPRTGTGRYSGDHAETKLSPGQEYQHRNSRKNVGTIRKEPHHRKDPQLMTNQELLNELLAMREVGIAVSDGALNHARLDDLSQYQAISVTELASLFCELYNVPNWKNP